MKLYEVEYLGYATADRRLSSPMIPWILAEIRKGGNVQKVNIYVFEIKLFIFSSFIPYKTKFIIHIFKSDNFI